MRDMEHLASGFFGSIRNFFLAPVDKAQNAVLVELQNIQKTLFALQTSSSRVTPNELPELLQTKIKKYNTMLEEFLKNPTQQTRERYNNLVAGIETLSVDLKKCAENNKFSSVINSQELMKHSVALDGSLHNIAEALNSAGFMRAYALPFNK